MILISATTIASPNSTILLQKGKPAPTTGAFVPEYRFKELETDASLKDKFQRQLADCEQSEMELMEENHGQAMAFLIGTATGMFLFWMGSQVGAARKRP